MVDLRQKSKAALIFTIGMVLSISFYAYIIDAENNAAIEQFNRTATERINTIESRINNKLTILKSVVAFYAGSNYVSLDEFNTFINTVSANDGKIQALEWIPAVPFRKRQSYVKSIQNQGFPSFQITEKNNQGKKVIAGKREFYYPVYYVVPYKGNEGAHGFDLGSNNIRLAALNKARDSGQPVASGLINLVQLKEKNAGVLVFDPVYDKKLASNTVAERKKYLQGFVLAVFRLSSLVSGSLAIESKQMKGQAKGIDIYLFDKLNKSEGELLYIHQSHSYNNSTEPVLTLNDVSKGIYVKHSIIVGGRDWTFILKPASGLLSTTTKFTSIVVLIISILISLLITLYYISSTNRTKLIEKEVGQRTVDLKEAVEIANNKERRIRAIVDNTGEGIITLTDEGIVSTVNPAFEKMFGYTKAEVVGKQFDILLPEQEDSEMEFNQLDFEMLLTTSQTFELLRKHKNGRMMLVELTLSSVFIADKKMYIGIIHDITARKETEKLKESFISTVSHELRTPMTSIKGSLSLLLSGSFGEVSDASKEMLGIAYNNAERLIRLINDILDVDKMASGKMSYDMRNQNLVQLLKESIENNLGYSKEYNVNFVLKTEISSAHIVFDYDRLMQVMANLLSNAAKFSQKGDDVIIRLDSIDKKHRVSVEDKGEGIPVEFRDSIFERFTQADSSDKKQIYGTGLGLSICQSIINAHNGILGFDSDLDKGTTFYFELP